MYDKGAGILIFFYTTSIKRYFIYLFLKRSWKFKNITEAATE